MTNPVHLIIDPDDCPEHLGMLMKWVAGRQTRYVNRLKELSGTLLEGCYKSSPIEEDAYLLTCCRYVDLNPLRAGMCAAPEEYSWPSCAARLGGTWPEWLDQDPTQLRRGETDGQQIRVYRDVLAVCQTARA